jgi:two-component system, OmpR family, sensor histidine kinase TctE
MRWTWLPERLAALSLRQRLLLWLLPLSVLITAVELWSTQRDAVAAANSAYDRSIRGALKAIEANISTASGGLAVELPYRLFELLELTATGHVYFRVATQDGLVEVGNLDLPMPEGGRPTRQHVPVFADAVYLGERVRMGTLLTHVKLRGEKGPDTPVLIQVAEQAQSREQFAAQFVQHSLRRAGLVLVALVGVLTLVVAWAMRPLAVLEAQVRKRKASDVSPLATEHLPRDVRPLVHAVNVQMARRQVLADQQRQFLDDASHQLRTPLATLRTQADFALRELQRQGDTPMLRHSLQAMAEQVDVATRGANQLLSLARSEATSVQRAPFDLAQMLREVVVPLLPRAASGQIDLGVDAPDTLVVLGEATLWREALSNLLDNALRHCPPGGQVTAQAAVVVSAPEAARWVLSVSNPAPTVDPSLLQVLNQTGDQAQRFVRGEGATQGGAGLGLAIARRIAERQGGRLEVTQKADGVFQACLSWPVPAGFDDQGLSLSKLKAN